MPRDFRIENRDDAPIDYVKDCKLWVLCDTGNIRIKCAVVPHPLVSYTTKNNVVDLHKDGEIQFISESEDYILPNSISEIRVGVTHYSDDTQLLKEILLTGCVLINRIQLNKEYHTSYKFKELVCDVKSVKV